MGKEQKTIPIIDLALEEEKYLVNLGHYEILFENGKTYFVKKELTYPKTYEECCKVLLGNESYSEFTFVPVKVGKTYSMGDFISELPFEIPYEREIGMLYKLLVCRDAYWKIAGEEMRLGGSWKYDMSKGEFSYAISYQYGCIEKNEIRYKNTILAFPTKEMRDTFYDNFKDLIEECKEFL